MTILDEGFWWSVVVFNSLAFALSVLSNNCSLGYDPYWSGAPLCLLWFFSATAAVLTTRTMLLWLLVSFWSLRLTHNCVSKWTSWPVAEDWRYRDLRVLCGRAFWLVSYLGIHTMPTLLTFFGSVPFVAIVSSDAQFTLVEVGAYALGFAAVTVELLADTTLAEHVARGNRGSVCEAGVWSLSRHPNYAGEVTFWWSVALASPVWSWSNFAGCIAITLLFVCISVPLLERRMARKGAVWHEYVARVPARLWPVLY
jgi:steroid 5-alpha reductase family enzyme